MQIVDNVYIHICESAKEWAWLGSAYRMFGVWREALRLIAGRVLVAAFMSSVVDR